MRMGYPVLGVDGSSSAVGVAYRQRCVMPYGMPDADLPRMVRKIDRRTIARMSIFPFMFNNKKTAVLLILAVGLASRSRGMAPLRRTPAHWGSSSGEEQIRRVPVRPPPIKRRADRDCPAAAQIGQIERDTARSSETGPWTSTWKAVFDILFNNIKIIVHFF